MEFTKKIGWARMGLLVSAALLVVMAVICFVGHEILPEALHTPNLPEGYTWPAGELVGAVVGLVAGVCQIAAWKNAGGSKALSGYLVMSGIMCCTCGLGALLDPVLGTFSFEWVVAVFGAFVAIAVFFGACSTKALGYKGMWIEIALAAVMVAVSLGVVIDSSMASTMAGLFFLAYAVTVALPAFMGDSIKLQG